MKCLSLTQIEEAVLSGPNEQLQRHLADCPSCTSRIEQVSNGQAMWPAAIYAEPLPPDFTDQVMASIQKFKAAPRPAKQRKQTRVWIAAASAAIILGSSLLYAVPSIAETVRLMFASDSAQDPGLQQARELGLVQNPHISVDDKGYRVSINEVVADAVRLTIAVQVTDRDGKVVRSGFDGSQLSIQDEHGGEAGELTVGDMNSGGDLLTYVYKGNVTDTKLFVVSTIDRIEQAQGNWKFSFPVDLSRAGSLTTVNTLDERYVTPAGMAIQMEKITHAPSGIKLELSTSLSEEAAGRTRPELEEMQQLMFHFEDGNGHVISSINDRATGSWMDAGTTSTRISGGIHWAFTFIGLPYDTQHVKFVLDGYAIPELTADTVVIDPSKLREQPAKFNRLGDTLEFRSLAIAQNPNSAKAETAGLLEVKGKFHNMGIGKENWQAVDEKGTIYPIDCTGIISFDKSNSFMANYEGIFVVKGLTALPKQLKLTRTVVDRFYANTDWSFSLPKGTQIPGLRI
ncbi:DUF4179 domain-containing protein [Paenibacillus sp. MMS18-CY102]|uniref:DUF4179 domain-containing protein n=1 Tax=Paenibacillus sp. MMS18-CY102 TaxID=2682849 RepID=UPI0013654705|nr:DUF4179 domain-containing protein [Paenibacillus sp. MMS18-CY102]MWC27749.1 DUF4179 domain-containing protein [Paenibacillus sp. MMS18-CY102]